MSSSLDLKRTFLSFAQHYFRDVPTRFPWSADARTTKIFIGDKFSALSGTLEKYPAIILSVNPKRWGRTSIDQRQEYPGFGVEELFKKRSDIVLSSVTYQCLSPNGIEAEQIADILFSGLVGYKDQFRKNGIHQLLDIQLGEEQLIRSDNEARLIAVGVTVFFAAQEVVVTSTANHDLRVYVDDLGSTILQSVLGIDSSGASYLNYTSSGLDVIFSFAPPSGLTLYADYLNAITLDRVREQFGTGDGTTTNYALSYIPYGYGYILAAVEFTETVSGLWTI